jgi:GGDEF domain-containing protein
VADTSFAYLTQEGTYATGAPSDVGWFAGYLLIVGRQLLTVLDNQGLNRRLAAMVGELEHQAFHDGLTNLPNRALFRERVGHALRRRSQTGIMEAMRPPFPLQGRHIQIGASVGVTVSDATEVDAVLRGADVAMYLAKARGKGRFELASAGGALDTVGTIPET